MINIAIADDHSVLRQGLKLLFNQEPDFNVIGEAEDGVAAVELVRKHDPDVIVMDIAMPRLNGIDAAEKIRQVNRHTKIVVLSMYANEAYLSEVKDNRVDSYVVKSETSTTLVKAIRDTVDGKRYVSPILSNPDTTTPISSSPVRRDASKVTPREREIVRLVTQGHTNTGIASRIGISQRTVETHRANVMRKMGFTCQAELIRWAIENGID